MSEHESSRSSSASSFAQEESAGLFAGPSQERSGSSRLAWVIAGVVVLVGLGLLLLTTRRAPKAAANTVQGLDPYAANLEFTGLQLSESASLSAVKVMYIDGTVRNTGDRTVTGCTLQVLFANDMQLPPQVETVPLTLIRTREPYVDTEPVSAAPLKPGEVREFRLIFENIGENWNQQIPQVRVIQVR